MGAPPKATLTIAHGWGLRLVFVHRDRSSRSSDRGFATTDSLLFTGDRGIVDSGGWRCTQKSSSRG
eukprot:9473939-Pyramimonas_sp.AAC.1